VRVLVSCLRFSSFTVKLSFFFSLLGMGFFSDLFCARILSSLTPITDSYLTTLYSSEDSRCYAACTGMTSFLPCDSEVFSAVLRSPSFKSDRSLDSSFCLVSHCGVPSIRARFLWGSPVKTLASFRNIDDLLYFLPLPSFRSDFILSSQALQL